MIALYTCEGGEAASGGPYLSLGTFTPAEDKVNANILGGADAPIMEAKTIGTHSWRVPLRLAKINDNEIFHDVGRAHAENRRYVMLDPALPFVTMGRVDFYNFTRAFL